MGLVSPEFLRYCYSLHLLCIDTLLSELCCVFWWAKAWCNLMQCVGCKIWAHQPFLTMGFQCHISLHLSASVTSITFWLNVCLLWPRKEIGLGKTVHLYWVAMIYAHANMNEKMQIPSACRYFRFLLNNTPGQLLWGHNSISWVVELIWPCATQHHMGYALIDLKGMARCDLILFTFM